MPTVVTVEELLGQLPNLLEGMSRDRRCLVSVFEFPDHRYVQCWSGANGSVVAEVISNVNVGEWKALTKEQETALLAQRWSVPVQSTSPNWSKLAISNEELVSMVGAISLAITGVLEKSLGTPVRVHTFELRPQKVHSSEESAVEQSRHYFQRSLEDLERSASGA